MGAENWLLQVVLSPPRGHCGMLSTCTQRINNRSINRSAFVVIGKTCIGSRWLSSLVWWWYHVYTLDFFLLTRIRHFSSFPACIAPTFARLGSASLRASGAEWLVLSWLPTLPEAEGWGGVRTDVTQRAFPVGSTTDHVHIWGGFWKPVPWREVKLKCKKQRLKSINMESVLRVPLHKYVTVARWNITRELSRGRRFNAQMKSLL